MKEIYYLSGDGRNRINLDREPYWIQTGDFMDYAWEYTTRNRRIIGFEKEVQEHDLTISVFGDTEEDYEVNLDHLHDILEGDVRAMTPGRLYVGGYYLKCYIIASGKSDWEYDCGIMDNTLTLATDYPHWVQEETRQFFPDTEAKADNGLDYPYDYDYDYTPDEAGLSVWVTGHYTACDYRLILYGPCTDPRILVNGKPIGLYDTLDPSDYVVVDSREHTVVKHLSNGTSQNKYDDRIKQDGSIFGQIPGGTLTLNWSGTFGFDLTLYKERSEPAWS